MDPLHRFVLSLLSVTLVALPNRESVALPIYFFIIIDQGNYVTQSFSNHRLVLMFAIGVAGVALGVIVGQFFLRTNGNSTNTNDTPTINSGNSGSAFDSLDSRLLRESYSKISGCLSVDDINKLQVPGGGITAGLREIESLKNGDQQVDVVCQNAAQPELFVAKLTRAVGAASEAPKSVIDNTRNLFPELSGRQLALEGEFARVEFAMVAAQTVKLSLGKASTSFQPNKLYSLMEFVWPSSLAGCGVENFNPSDGSVTISCGSGDNGCYEVERVRYDLKTSKAVRVGVCTKNCDLRAGETSELVCSN